MSRWQMCWRVDQREKLTQFMTTLFHFGDDEEGKRKKLDAMAAPEQTLMNALSEYYQALDRQI